MSSTATAETFVDAVLAGHALVEDIDDWADRWHDAGGLGIDLHEYLGMSWDEYALWVEQPDSIRFIVAAHRYSTPVTELLVSRDEFALAARSQSPGAAEKVLLWLVETGRIDPEQASHA
ncbi:hypothetical protein B7C42_07768 [Nocardia cerradoensis]|uniref:Uncharacterized protein n=1 Tax=Nocardia cerradoensis TaxID=85688 RepID=A0A231GU46_9NOCA|nr:hypothetical protein [Nocardia cerradoensis]OXR40144.1 hypothetical protein B7C42_07768 [Nocardia cerradoensis]